MFFVECAGAGPRAARKQVFGSAIKGEPQKLSTCGKLMWKTAIPVDNYKTSRADCARPANKNEGLSPSLRYLYSDVFPLCLVQPLVGFGSHLYTATLRPLRWWDFVSKAYPFCVELPLWFGLLPSPCIYIIARVVLLVNTFFKFFLFFYQEGGLTLSTTLTQLLATIH